MLAVAGFPKTDCLESGCEGGTKATAREGEEEKKGPGQNTTGH